MEDIIVRSYEEKDKEAFRNICIKTAQGFKVQTDSQRELLCLLFNDYYTENEQATCFAASVNGQAIGYIIAARDFAKYREIFNSNYMPRIKKLSLIQWLFRKIGLCYEKKVSKEYPAHLHIDILDGYQRMGLGHKLMNALLIKLRELKVSGVCLFVGAKNEKGIKFYKKYGFSEVKKIAGSICFGLKLD